MRRPIPCARFRFASLSLTLLCVMAQPARTAQAQDVRPGPEVVASVDTAGGQLKVEPAVVLSDSVVVVAWNDSRAGREYGVRAGIGIGWSYSVDGGQSFRFGGYLPDPGEFASPAAADSWLVHDGSGTIYLQILHWPDEGQKNIRVYALSTDRPDQLEFRGTAVSGNGLDKPALTVGPGGELWTVYTDRSRIFSVRSTDGGRSWSAPNLLSDDSSAVIRSGADVVVCGGRVVVAWVQEARQETVDEKNAFEGATGIWTAATPLNDVGFAPPVQAYRLPGPLPVPQGYSLGLGQMSRIPNNAWLTCSPERGDDHVLLAFARPMRAPQYGPDGTGRMEGTGSQAVMMTARSITERLAWTLPEPISEAAGRYQAFPAVDATDRGSAAVYYDWRHAVDGAGTDVYVTLRTPTGRRDVRLTNASSSWPDLPGDPEDAVVQRNVGDYIGIDGDGDGGRWAVAWTDGRTGRSEILVRIVELR